VLFLAAQTLHINTYLGLFAWCVQPSVIRGDKTAATPQRLSRLWETREDEANLTLLLFSKTRVLCKSSMRKIHHESCLQAAWSEVIQLYILAAEENK